MNSLIKNTPLKSLIKRSIPPLYKDLLIWTNRVYDPTTHQIKSRISPQHLTLKQGLVAKGNDLDDRTQIVSITTIELAKTQSFEINFCANLNTFASPFGNNNDGVDNSYMYFNTARIRFNWAGTNIDFALAGSNGVNYCIAVTYNGNQTGANNFTATRTNLDTGAVDTANATGNTSGFADAKMSIMFNPIKNTASVSSRSQQWDHKLYVNGALTRYYPLDGHFNCVVSGDKGVSSGAVVMTTRNDFATFYCDEYGFAVKSGVIYPKLLDGSGYAGLVGAPDVVYQGLIATKGQPEIGTKQYLGTEYDFGDAEAITDAGISWDEWDGEDTNLDTVGTAETDLDTDYYSAITASLMTNTSIAGYAGTSNVKSRLFFKVADRVMKDDGSFLAESGRVQEILVYKRDLSASEILRVQKYCREVTE